MKKKIKSFAQHSLSSLRVFTCPILPVYIKEYQLAGESRNILDRNAQAISNLNHIINQSLQSAAKPAVKTSILNLDAINANNVDNVGSPLDLANTKSIQNLINDNITNHLSESKTDTTKHTNNFNEIKNSLNLDGSNSLKRKLSSNEEEAANKHDLKKSMKLSSNVTAATRNQLTNGGYNLKQKINNLKENNADSNGNEEDYEDEEDDIQLLNSDSDDLDEDDEEEDDEDEDEDEEEEDDEDEEDEAKYVYAQDSDDLVEEIEIDQELAPNGCVNLEAIVVNTSSKIVEQSQSQTFQNSANSQSNELDSERKKIDKLLEESGDYDEIDDEDEIDDDDIDEENDDDLIDETEDDETSYIKIQKQDDELDELAATRHDDLSTKSSQAALLSNECESEINPQVNRLPVAMYDIKESTNMSRNLTNEILAIGLVDKTNVEVPVESYLASAASSDHMSNDNDTLVSQENDLVSEEVVIEQDDSSKKNPSPHQVGAHSS